MIAPTTSGGVRRAAAAAEFAILLTILVPLLVGIWEVGRLVNASQLVMNAAREASRRASTGTKTTADIRQEVLTYLQAAGLTRITAVASDEEDLKTGGKVLVDIKVYDDDGVLIADGDPKTDAKQNNKLVITVKVLYTDVEYSPTNFFLSSDFQLIATTTWNSMKDIPLTVNDQIPLY